MSMERLIKEHWKFIKANSYKVAVYHRLDGDDIYCKVLERLIVKQHLFDFTKDFKTWVMFMTKNICLNEREKRGTLESKNTFHVDTVTVHPAENPSFESKDSLERIVDYLKGKYKYWDVIKMVVDGYSQEEISKINGRAISSNQSTLYEIRRDLKQFSSIYLN